jgi:acetyltransferase-like isoleucine patch superfamily enzyme
MINKIKNKIRKVFLKQPPPAIQDLIKYKNQISKDPSSILLPNSVFDFRLEPENRNYITIGEKCIIGARFIFESKKGGITIGNNVHIGSAMLISKEEIIIEDDVTMAWGITIYDHNSHSIHWEERKNDNIQCYSDYINHDSNNIVNKDWVNVKSEKIRICSRAWIGFNAVILKGVTIGEGAVVGACSVVTKSVPPYTVVGGNPAKEIKKIK